MMVPFLWMISTSLKTRAEVFAVPPTLFPPVPQWQNYPDMWNALPFATFFINSLKLASLNTVGQLISCSMAAFAFAALRFRFREPLFALLLVTLIIPFQVVLVPNFILYRLLPHPLSASGNWIGTQEPLWVGAFLGGAFGTFLLRQFFLAIPRELADAARVDGANPWQIYRHIYLPLAKPALATLAIFTFMWSWNDLIDPIIYLRDIDTFTLTAGLSLFQGQYVGQVAAAHGRRARQRHPDDHPVRPRPAALRPRDRHDRDQGMSPWPASSRAAALPPDRGRPARPDPDGRAAARAPRSRPSPS